MAKQQLIPDKKRDLHTFDGGIDTDTAPEYVAPNRARYMLNCRVYSYGNVGVITNIQGNTLISTPLPAGINQCINSTPDEANNRFFFSVYNSLGYHTIFLYNEISNQVIQVFQSQTQSDGIDILTWSPNFPILHVDIVGGNLYYWCDGLNKAGKFNITKIMDSTAAGYGLSITADFIVAYKQTALFAPVCNYTTDTTRDTNNLYANLFKFTQRWHYDDGEISNWSDWSAVPLPDNQSYLGISGITNTNNAIQVNLATGNHLVVKIEVAVQAANNQIPAVNEVNTTDFVVCQILTKADLGISDLSTYTWVFYNDGSYSTTDQGLINRLYSFLPRIPLCQSFIRNALTYTNFSEGYDNVTINASVACSFVTLYIPSGTVNTISNGSITVAFVSVVKQRQFTALSLHARYNPTYLFTIGSDVVKGQVYNVYGRGGGPDFNIIDLLGGATPIAGGENYFYSYTATANDTAETVAAQIKAFQRGIGRGWPTNQNAISNEQTSGGNVSWEYGYLGYLGQGQLVWTASVTQVPVVTLQDNGFSSNIIKYGSTRNYGFVYIDDDGRESLAYTSPTSVVRTPFITEIGLDANGNFQQPIHAITINHQPPIWAKWWRLVRTPDTPSFIWILIQQVILYTGEDGDGNYLDLVVGSLPTYNLLHPNSVLAYNFTRGDRLRLIVDTGSGLLYPYYETEILSYQVSTSQTINSNIVVNGTNIVTPTATVNPDQAGFNIIINGNIRLIVDVNTGPNTYTLDEPIVVDETTTPTTPTTFPNYILQDNRGTIRIAQPTAVTINPNSIVELYTPQPNLVSSDYRIFNDFQQKFPILNYGTPQAYHAGNQQNQSATQPAIVTTSNGDAYIRDREYPTNTVFPGTQVTVYKAVDPNFSDFYYSSMTNLGRVYPQDQGLGQVDFGSRVRFSSNYIQDTTVNGLNDFDDLNRMDYFDSYGDIMRTLFREAKLYAFKQLKDAWIPVNNVISTDASGANALLVGTSQLLNLMEYYNYEGGVGNNPESVTYNGDFIYHACPAAGTFVKINTSYVYGRQVTDNIETISKNYFFDFAAKQLLAIVQQYNLKLYSGFDRGFDEGLWTILPYIEYLFNGGFDPNIWSTLNGAIPVGAIGIVVTQPTNGNVVWNGATGDFVVTMNTGFLGNDQFTYQLLLPGSVMSATRNVCITVSEPPNRPKGYQVQPSSAECVLVPYTPPPADNFSLFAQYGFSIYSVDNQTTTGIPASAHDINLADGSTVNLAYTEVTPGTFGVILLGAPVVFGKVFLVLQINNVAVQTILANYADTYIMTMPSATSNPTNITIALAMMG